MHLLALDVGTRRTGCAFADDADGIVLALETFVHTSVEELSDKVSSLAKARKVEHIIVGNPLLLSGAEGSQTDVVKMLSQMLQKEGFSVTLFDERYTTPDRPLGDGDAEAACTILLTYLARNGI